MADDERRKHVVVRQRRFGVRKIVARGLSTRRKSHPSMRAAANHLRPIRSIPIGVERSKRFCERESKKNFDMVNRGSERSSPTALRASFAGPCGIPEVKRAKKEGSKTLMLSMFLNIREKWIDMSGEIDRLYRRCAAQVCRCVQQLVRSARCTLFIKRNAAFSIAL